MKVISFTQNDTKKYVKEFKFDITGHTLIVTDDINEAWLFPDTDLIPMQCVLGLIELTFGKVPMAVTSVVRVTNEVVE